MTRCYEMQVTTFIGTKREKHFIYVTVVRWYMPTPSLTINESYYGGNIQRYASITVAQTAPFQTINLNIDLLVSMAIIKQVAFQVKLLKSSEANIVLKERGFNQMQFYF